VTQHRYVAKGWGVGEVWAEDGMLVLHDLAGTVAGLDPGASASAAADVSEQVELGRRQTLPPEGGTRAPTGTVATKSSRGENAFVPDLCRRFAAHLAGVEVHYDDVRIDDTGLTPFQRALLVALRAVPWGEVVSYGELSQLAGRPRAARAAGTFCAENQFSLVVPCHRVVASSGIGGYGPSGVTLKRRLLALEGVEL
jgi:methylated-DNA-[protein]-cysteine S-methyltransferase